MYIDLQGDIRTIFVILDTFSYNYKKKLSVTYSPAVLFVSISHSFEDGIANAISSSK